jgi:hypothetical protein
MRDLGGTEPWLWYADPVSWSRDRWHRVGVPNLWHPELVSATLSQVSSRAVSSCFSNGPARKMTLPSLNKRSQTSGNSSP